MQLIVHLSLAPSVWSRKGPRQVFMANLIYGAEDTAVWPQTGIQTEVTGVRVREMTHMCPNTHTYKHVHTAHAIIAQIFCKIEQFISIVIFINMLYIYLISITAKY